MCGRRWREGLRTPYILSTQTKKHKECVREGRREGRREMALMVPDGSIKGRRWGSVKEQC